MCLGLEVELFGLFAAHGLVCLHLPAKGRKLDAVESNIDTGDALLRCRVHGGDGPLVLCAHGFPDCERSFREQLGPLTDAGYRVAVPTMRGYAPSGTSRTGHYDAAALGHDLLAIADALSPDQPVRLLGHDWGAIACYAATALKPERFSHLVTAAVPHLREAGPRWTRPAQLRRSWYMGLFQLPFVAERRLRADDMALIDRLWSDWSPGYRCPADEMRFIKDAITPNLGAVLGYYRALKNPFGDSRRLLFARTTVPAMYLHGADDGCVGVDMCRGTERAFARGIEVQIVPAAGHWVHLEQPEVVNRLLVDFYSQCHPPS